MIREAKAEDCAAVHALAEALEGRTLDGAAFREIYLRQRSSPAWRCLVFETVGETVGFINVRIEAQLHHAGRVAEIVEFAVRDDLCGGGIGRRHFEAACAAARAAGCGHIEVACNRARHAAHRFYGHCGMENTHFRFTLPLAL